MWPITAVDMVAVPLYAFILIELCRPGYLTRRTMTAHLLPFVILPALLIATRIEIIYFIEVAWAAVYGFRLRRLDADQHTSIPQAAQRELLLRREHQPKMAAHHTILVLRHTRSVDHQLLGHRPPYRKHLHGRHAPYLDVSLLLHL